MAFKVSLLNAEEANSLLEAASKPDRIKGIAKLLHINITGAEDTAFKGEQMQLDDLLRNGRYIDKGFKQIQVHATIDGPNGKPRGAMLEAHPKIIAALQTQMIISHADAKPLLKALRDVPGKG